MCSFLDFNYYTAPPEKATAGIIREIKLNLQMKYEESHSFAIPTFPVERA